MRHPEHYPNTSDFGPEPFVVNIACSTEKNLFYRRTLWTGSHLQLTLMCIPPCGEIGLEVHPDTDQFLRIEEGQGTVLMGSCKGQLNFQRSVCQDDAIFVPCLLYTSTFRSRPNLVAEMKGFEPLHRQNRPTGFRIRTLQPLGYISVFNLQARCV